ncbi:MAG TPA: OmpH family outer membrane protein [Candidatus Sumerlaeota bacterium]|nr:OmpH family outer membrane protein [Candidatus Sumerlaeota bacterium]HOR27413.1 OmpH family outer membrane protein [Candidatus Sumerlaeota bacterium]HPK03305.1 OmpH family outer membrane protein [Candidatus Sumerlaeota bacterium]
MHRSVFSPRGLALWVVGAILLAAPLRAQSIKIGIVDMELVTNRSASIQNRMKSAESSMQSQKAELDEKYTRLQRLRRDLRDQRSVLSESQISEKEAQIRDLDEEVNDLQYEINKQIERVRTDVIEPELNRIEATIERVAREGQYDLILVKDAVLFSSEKVDITPLIIQALDRESGRAPQLPESGEIESENEE